MRRLLFICSLFLYIQTQGQELQGKYHASFIGGETINFVGADSFYFRGFYCNFVIYGRGICEISNDYLYLYFEGLKSKRKKDSSKDPIILSTSCTDKICNISVVCVDNKDNPVPFVKVILFRNKKFEIGTSTDASGKALLKAKKEDFPLTIQTSMTGINSVNLKLDTAASYSVKLFYSSDPGYPFKELNNGEVYVYKISSLSESLIEMTPEQMPRLLFLKYRQQVE